jgi:hypothetical protein
MLVCLPWSVLQFNAGKPLGNFLLSMRKLSTYSLPLCRRHTLSSILYTHINTLYPSDHLGPLYISRILPVGCKETAGPGSKKTPSRVVYYAQSRG